MNFRRIKDLKGLKNKTVLVRADFNVPIKDGEVADNFKIKKGLPTLEYLIGKKAKVIVVTHLGRPDGYNAKFSLKPVQKELGRLLKKNIDLLDVRNWDQVVQKTGCLSAGDVTLLDNIRFIKGEEQNSRFVSKKLASLADVFVLDGFAVAHRDASSVSGVAKYLPAYAGLLFAEEIKTLSELLKKPKKPFVVILGGAKMETKIPVLKNLLAIADRILLGGGIINTYLWASGCKVGDSIVSKDFKKQALKYCSKKKVIMPVDLIVGRENGEYAHARKVNKKLDLKKGMGIYDIGPETIKLYAKYIKSAQTLVWNGAVGHFEQHPYQYGTYSIARLVAARSKGKAVGICGGGETVEVLEKLNLSDDIDLVSTGGGAMLEFLSGKNLPGVKAVRKSKFF